MSRNEDIDNAIWGDPDFEVLSADASLLYIWSWTNPRCDMAGIYKVSHGGMTQCKVPLERIPATLAELDDARFLFYEQQVLWVRARVGRIRSRSPQMAKAVAKDLWKIRFDHPLVVRFMKEYGSAPWLRDALKRPSPDGMETLSENPIDKGDSDRSSDTSLEVPLTGKGKGQGPIEDGGSGGKADLPDDFPDELRQHMPVLWRGLTAFAERRGSKAIKPLSLVSLVQSKPHKPLVEAMYEFFAYWDALPSGPKDVIAAFRNWLGKTPDLAGFERLDDAGRPTSNVTQLRAGRTSAVSELHRKLNAAEAAQGAA